MKTIFLLRHAKSGLGEAGMADRNRPLNRRGEQAAQAIADHLIARAVRPDLILCSTATRTRQTLAPLVERLAPPVPPIALESGLYLASEGALLKRLCDLPDKVGTVLVIGHNDGIWMLAQALAGDGKASLLASVRDKYPTGGLATLQVEMTSWSRLKPGIATLVAFTCPRDLA